MSNYTFFVGSYGAAEQEALHIVQLDSATGELTRLGGKAGLARPSFVTWEARKSVLYVISENEGGQVSAYRLRQNGELAQNEAPAQNVKLVQGEQLQQYAESGMELELELLGTMSTGGAHSCHVSFSPCRQWLYTVNYSGGQVQVYPLDAQGRIGQPVQQVLHTGSSVHKTRQEKAHPHSARSAPWHGLLLVPDLGTDELQVYKVDEGTGKLALHQTVRAEAGAGPRHVCFHPVLERVYCVEELSSTVTVYALDGNQMLQFVQRVSVLPEAWQGHNTSAEVAIDAAGRTLYASNRGHDTLAVLAIGEEGTLTPKGFVPTGGATPRHFALSPDGRWLVVANQESDWLEVLAVDEQGGLTRTGKGLALEKPVCCVFQM